MAEREPLILLPGLLNDEDVFAEQVAALRDVCAPAVMPLTTAESMTALATAVLRAAPPKFALAGFSMGGYCALAMLRQAPERITRVALLNTSARPDDPATAIRRRGLIQLSQKGEFKGVTPLLLPLILPAARLSDEALTGRVMAMAQRLGRDVFIRQQNAIMSRVDSRPYLARITQPTLIIAGTEDGLTPKALSEEMAQMIPGATLTVLPGCGHVSPLEQPAAVTAALRAWLALPAVTAG